MTLSVRSRFEVFKRDAFTCRYCGRTIEADGVKLEVDHITPRAAGGSDEITNLVTSCWDCNRGKGAKSLDDKAPSLTVAMSNTRERSLQLDEYRQWQASLDDVNNRLLVRVWQEWIDTFGGRKEPIEDNKVQWYSDDVGMPSKAALFSYFGDLEVAEIIDAMQTSHRKWVAGGLSDYDVQRYFFGCLKHKKSDKAVPAEIVFTSDEVFRAYESGRQLGLRQQRDVLRDLFINHETHGYATFADVVAALAAGTNPLHAIEEWGARPDSEDQ